MSVKRIPQRKPRKRPLRAFLVFPKGFRKPDAGETWQQVATDYVKTFCKLNFLIYTLPCYKPTST